MRANERSERPSGLLKTRLSRLETGPKKAGYTATLVVCGWAGAIFEVTRPFGQEQRGQKIKIIKKGKCIFKRNLFRQSDSSKNELYWKPRPISHVFLDRSKLNIRILNGEIRIKSDNHSKHTVSG